MIIEKEDLYQSELTELEQEHDELNQLIDSLDEKNKFSEFTLQKFKKRKLLIKDRIKYIKSILFPDIIA